MRALPKQLAMIVCLAVLLSAAGTSAAAGFSFTNLTDGPAGPGQGSMPDINRWGDVAFVANDSVYVRGHAGGPVTNIMTLAGAPGRGWHPRLSDSGDLAFIDPADRHVWLFDAADTTFTDLATRPGFPGVSGLHSLYGAFDLNNNGQLALHAGDLNFGDIFLYDHATGQFSQLTGLPGAPSRGRDCSINDAGQVAYTGDPDTYVYNLGDGTTRNITDLPGGPGTGLPAAMLNDAGDIAISSGGEVMRFTAAGETFWYLSTLPGFPVSTASVDRNCLADNGAISFWADEIYYFDPVDSTFTQLTSQGIVPFSGHESKMNEANLVAFEAGGDIWLAAPSAAPAGPSAAVGLQLAQNQPNPFNPQTRIAYVVPPGGALIGLEILDLRGYRVRTLVSEHQAAGERSVMWDGRDGGGRAVASGTYFYRLQAPGQVAVRAMQLVR